MSRWSRFVGAARRRTVRHKRWPCGDPGRLITTRSSAAVNTASNAAVSLVSRPRIRERNWSARSPRSVGRLRACAVREPGVLVVTPGCSPGVSRFPSRTRPTAVGAARCRRAGSHTPAGRRPGHSGAAARSARPAAAPVPGRPRDQDASDGAFTDAVAQAEQFAPDPAVPHRGFSVANPISSSRTSSGTGGRPASV
jgi:hypothetical protein